MHWTTPERYKRRAGENMKRGRPKLTMTPLRERVRNEYLEALSNDRLISLSRLARNCGLDSYRDARRVMNDLRQMGAV